MACIRLKPKSSHTIKYSQPFELVLFHIIVPHINCFKCFYYPQLLNNYLKQLFNFPWDLHKLAFNAIKASTTHIY